MKESSKVKSSRVKPSQVSRKQRLNCDGNAEFEHSLSLERHRSNRAPTWDGRGTCTNEVHLHIDLNPPTMLDETVSVEYATYQSIQGKDL